MAGAEEPEREVHRPEGTTAAREGGSDHWSKSGPPETSPGMKSRSSPSSPASPASPESSHGSLQEMFEQQGRALARWKREDPSFVVHARTRRHRYYPHDHDGISTVDEKTIESDQDEDDDGESSAFSGSSSCGGGSRRPETAHASSVKADVDYLSVVSSERNHGGDDFSLTSSIMNLQERFNVFGGTLLDAGEDSSHCFDLEGTDSEILQAISEIRREASQMDMVMTLDQLKTLQSELVVAARQFEARSLEAEHLRNRLEEMEERAANSELERDLHRADANKLREDLETCIELMFDISTVAGQSTLEAEGEANDEANDRPRNALVLALKEKLQQLAFGETACMGPVEDSTLLGDRQTHELPQTMCILGLSEQPRPVLRHWPIVRDQGFTSVDELSEWSDCSDSVRLLPSLNKGSEPRNQDVFRRRSYSKALRRSRTESFQKQSRQEAYSYSSIGLQSKQPRRRRSSSGDRNRDRQSMGMVDRSERGDKMCGIFRRRSKGVSVSEKDVSVMKSQIKRLDALMKTYMAASEKLRKRLATISHYYEGVICKLEEQVAELKAENSSAEVGLRDQLATADLERRMTLSRFESELRKKDEEIAILKYADHGEV